jgi:hypothetical protein
MTPDPQRPLKVFLCHAHADRDPVRELYTRLTQDGVDVWLDKASLLPGQDWELEIRKAVREADVVVVCLSKQFNQAGFRQKEVRLALDTAMEKPEGEIFIIPARLEECDNLENLRKWHWVDLFEDDGYEKIKKALSRRAEKVNAKSPQKADFQSVSSKSVGQTFSGRQFSFNDRRQKINKRNLNIFLIFGIFLFALFLMFKYVGNKASLAFSPTISPTVTFTKIITPTFTGTTTPTKAITLTATKILQTDTPTATATPEFTDCVYKVQPNDSVYAISNRFGVNIDSVRDKDGNSLPYPDLLVVGKEVLILNASTRVCLEQKAGISSGTQIPTSSFPPNFSSNFTAIPDDYSEVLYIRPDTGSIISSQSQFQIGIHYNLSSYPEARLIVMFVGYSDADCKRSSEIQNVNIGPLDAISEISMGDKNIELFFSATDVVNVFEKYDAPYFGIESACIIADVNGVSTCVNYYDIPDIAFACYTTSGN